MKRLKLVDVAIVGGGWTGLAMANEIASRTSLSVLVLERGPMHKTSEYATTMDELDYAIRLRFMQNIADETITHRHSGRQSAVPVRQYGSFLPGSGVGGAGEHWNGNSFRYSPEVFQLRTHLKERYGSARVAENLAVQDWGVTYDDLEPYYWRVEQMMGVSGKAGNLRGKPIPGGNIFEGRRQFEYPTPPLKRSYFMTLFEEGAKQLGYHPYPVPAATLSEAYRNPDGVSRAGCAYCGYCESFGCMVGAKAQPTNTLMPLLSRRKNFALRTGSWVRRVVHRDARALGVQYTAVDGEEFFQPADIVVLASFTLNNVRLLYLSGVGVSPDTSSTRALLGRNLTHQIMMKMNIFFDRPMNAFMGTGALGTAVSDFDGDRALNGSDGILRGGTFLAISTGNRPIQTFDTLPPGAVKTNWGSEWKKAALAWRDKVGSVVFFGEHMSYRQNCMDLDPTYTDKFGDPLLRVTLDWSAHEQRQRIFAHGIFSRIARQMGARTYDAAPAIHPYNVTQYQSTHLQGGAMMGVSRENSVVNTHLQHWDVPNLWVIGASSFPQNASVNPTLTALAVTYRASDALIDRYLKHPGALA